MGGSKNKMVWDGKEAAALSVYEQWNWWPLVSSPPAPPCGWNIRAMLHSTEVFRRFLLSEQMTSMCILSQSHSLVVDYFILYKQTLIIATKCIEIHRLYFYVRPTQIFHFNYVMHLLNIKGKCRHNHVAEPLYYICLHVLALDLALYCIYLGHYGVYCFAVSHLSISTTDLLSSSFSTMLCKTI